MELHTNQIEKRSWIEVDIDQIINNYETYKASLACDANVMAVIKADAYGHGDTKVARALERRGVRLFAVSNIDEAVNLRDAGINGEILILGYTSPALAKVLYERNITQTLVSEEYAEALSKEGIKVKCQFAIDTGMNRIGLDADEPDLCEATIRKYAKILGLNGIFTHLCVADIDKDSCVTFTHFQVAKFKNIVDKVSDLKLPYAHCCNSAGGLFYLKNSKEFESISRIVRLGIILYGLKPDNSNKLPDAIQPALSWKTVVSMVKDVHAGETIGYGRTYTLDSNSKIATITTGYADGYNRQLSNKGCVLIHGKKAPIVGRICMDQMMIDVTDIPETRMGDCVVLLGKDGGESYTADDMAETLGTISYEIVCGISKRVQRFYV